MKLPRAPTSGCGIHRNAPSAGCRWLVGKVSRIDYLVVPKTTGWENVQRVSGGLGMLVQQISEVEEWDAILLQELSFHDEFLSLEE